jgi:hypothetical protein
MAGGALGGAGTIVIVQRGGTLDSVATTDRTWPVTIDPPDLTVAVLPLNWAMRKRRTSFWLVVSNVIMKPSCALRDHRPSLLAMYEHRQPYKYGCWRNSDEDSARRRRC